MPGRSRRTTGKKPVAKSDSTQSAAIQKAAASSRKRSNSDASSASSGGKRRKTNKESDTSSLSSSNDDDNQEDDDDDDDDGDDGDDGDNGDDGDGGSPDGDLSSSALSAPSIVYNTSLLNAKDSFVWKPVLSPEDYTTLSMVLTESVKRSMPHLHIQDPRAVENVARHLAWTQIWDLNQARANAYENLTPLNSGLAAEVISNTVYYCVDAAVQSDTCILFERIMENEIIFQKLQSHLVETFSSVNSGVQNLVIDQLIGKAVEFLKSKQFLDIVCKEMFQEQGMPRFQCTEMVIRKLFDEWNRVGTATEAMKRFAASIVDRTSHYFINQRVRVFFN